MLVFILFFSARSPLKLQIFMLFFLFKFALFEEESLVLQDATKPCPFKEKVESWSQVHLTFGALTFLDHTRVDDLYHDV